MDDEDEELELELELEEEEELELKDDDKEELEIEDDEEELELELEEEELELLRSASSQRPLNSLTDLIEAKLPPSVTTRISVPTNSRNRSSFVRLEFFPNIGPSIYPTRRKTPLRLGEFVL